MSAAVSVTDHFVSELSRIGAALPGAANAAVQQSRQRALERFRTLGLPSPRDEHWKYTSLKPIEKRSFRTALPADGGTVDPELLEAARLQGLEALELVFVNGHFRSDLSRLDAALPPDVSVTALSALEPGEAEGLAALAAQEQEQAAFAALNGALFTDGARVALAAGCRLERPIHLLFIAGAGPEPLARHPRIRIELGAAAQATVVESYFGAGDAAGLTNTLTEIDLQAGAALEHCKLQREGSKTFHIGDIRVRQARDSHLASHVIALGAQISRNDLRIRLEAEGAEAVLNGLYMAAGRQHVDNHTRVDHLQPHTRSEEYYKGVLDGRARGVFNGKVVVHAGADKTDARQANHNLLLDAGAEADTKPELEIYADDVKCSHGATVGQIDADALFYLRSRGVDAAAAQALLTYAFADDVIGRIGLAPIRASLERAVIGRLPEHEQLSELV